MLLYRHIFCFPWFNCLTIFSGRVDAGIIPKSPCCGSNLPLQDIVPTGHFFRVVSAQSFYVSFGAKRDVLPPSRIMDLAQVPTNSVSRYKKQSMEVTLTWTATGGDYLQGAAARYEIRTATKVGYLTGEEFEVKGILVHPSLTPSPGKFGAREKSVVRVPWPNEVFYYAVVAIDEAGNRGEISNKVAVYIHEEPTTTTSTTTTTTTITTTTTTITTTSTTTTTTATTTTPVSSLRRSDVNVFKVETTPAHVVFLPTRILPRIPTPGRPGRLGEGDRPRWRDVTRRRVAESRTREPRLGMTPVTLPKGFLSIRDLFEADILDSNRRSGDYNRIERNTVSYTESEDKKKLKDEVYAITGAGGSLLVLTILISLMIVRRYRKKLLENSDSTTFRRNSVDFSPSFQHNDGDGNSLNKIYSLVKMKEGVKEESKTWLNPLAKPSSEAGSATSRATKSTVDGGDNEEGVKTVNKTKEEAGADVDDNKDGIDLVTKAEMEGIWPVPEGERGKLLLEIYNGGTFKKSMNYHSFRDSDKGRQSREISIDNLETDSLEISGSQLTVLPSSETSRRSRLSDIFPDILNFKSMETMGSLPEVRDTPSPDYNSPEPDLSPDNKSLSSVSYRDAARTSDEKPVGQAQYYFGDHVIEKRAERGESENTSETKVKFNLDLRSAMFTLSPSHPPHHQPDPEPGLSSLDILPENPNPSLNRARLRKLFESQSKSSSNKRRQRTPNE